MTTRDEVSAALADIHNIEGVNAVAVVIAVDLADPLWRVAEAAQRMSDKRTSDSDGYWVSAREMRYVDAALTDLDAAVEELK